MADEKKPEEKKPNPILNELDKEAAGQAPSSPAAQPAEAAASAVPLPAAETSVEKSEPLVAETPAPVAPPAEDSPQELVSDAMRRLDDILKKIKDKKVDPAP